MKPTTLLPSLSALLLITFTSCDPQTTPCLIKQDGKDYNWTCEECPVIERFTHLQEDQASAEKIAAWRTYVSDPNNRLTGMHNIGSFYIDKTDLMKLLCDECRETEGIVITLGYDPGDVPHDLTDTSTIRPRKLIPFVSAAKLNKTINSYDPIGNTNMHTVQGCPSDWCGAANPFATQAVTPTP